VPLLRDEQLAVRSDALHGERWQLSFHQLPDAVNIALLEVLHQHLFHFQVVLSHCIGLFAGLEAYRIA
jgi:hypothetical protein